MYSLFRKVVIYSNTNNFNKPKNEYGKHMKALVSNTTYPPTEPEPSWSHLGANSSNLSLSFFLASPTLPTIDLSSRCHSPISPWIMSTVHSSPADTFWLELRRILKFWERPDSYDNFGNNWGPKVLWTNIPHPRKSQHLRLPCLTCPRHSQSKVWL